MYYSKGVWVSRRRGEDDNDNSKSPRIDSAKREVDKDENVNGTRGTLRNQRRDVINKASGPSDEPHCPSQPNGQIKEKPIVSGVYCVLN